MAKFIKSIFYNPERRRSSKGDFDEDRSDNHLAAAADPASGRTLARNLSISRSGRMRQANKKRYTLTKELYGDEHIQDKPKSKEYHVNPIIPTELPAKTTDLKLDNDHQIPDLSNMKIKTPEEEIDSAFEILDKS